MEGAMGLGSVASWRSSIVLNTRQSSVSRRNAYPGAPSSAPRCVAQKRQRKLVAVEENVDGGFLKKTLADIRERSALVLAPLLSGLLFSNVQFALADEDGTSGADSLNFELPQIELPQIDVSGLTGFVSENPLAVIGGVAALALPVIVTTVLNRTEGYGTVSAKEAYTKLGEKDFISQILDIRLADVIKSDGTPDLRKFKKRVIQVPYAGEPDEYLAKVSVKFKDPENTTLYILDRFDGNSSTVAKLVLKGGFKGAYVIKDGAEGPSGWQNSELPWLVPSKGFSLDLGGLKDLLSSSDSSAIVPTTLGVAAAAGVGLVVFSEAETALQLLGSAALIQVFVRKFLFAKDRKKTLEELQTFLDTKVAPKDLVDELKGIAGVLLPKFEEVQTAGSVNGSAILENTVETTPQASVSETPAPETSAPAAAALETLATVMDPETPTPTEDSQTEEPAEGVDTASRSSTDLPRTPKPLSPYAQYPYLKPPTSPTPSRP